MDMWTRGMVGDGEHGMNWEGHIYTTMSKRDSQWEAAIKQRKLSSVL